MPFSLITLYLYHCKVVVEEEICRREQGFEVSSEKLLLARKNWKRTDLKLFFSLRRIGAVLNLFEGGF
jgi:hypothetical protein